MKTDESARFSMILSHKFAKLALGCVQTLKRATKLCRRHSGHILKGAREIGRRIEAKAFANAPDRRFGF